MKKNVERTKILKKGYMSSSSWKGVKWIAFGWSAFLAENLILSENREEIISSSLFGGSVEKYRRLYSGLSVAAMGSVAYGYFMHGRRQGPMLSQPILAGKFGRFFGLTLQGFGVAGLLHLYLPKLQVPITSGFSFQCPIDYKSSRASIDKASGNRASAISSEINESISSNASSSPTEIFRITRHPMLWSLALTSLPWALMTRYVSHVVMFSGPTLMALLGGWHQDRVRLSSDRTTREYLEATSNVPGWALLTGKQDVIKLMSELRWVNVALGLSIPFIVSLLSVK